MNKKLEDYRKYYAVNEAAATSELNEKIADLERRLRESNLNDKGNYSSLTHS